MKQVQRVSLGGYAFVMEPEAVERCNNYLSDLEKHYGKGEDGKEIMEGIEERFAELILERAPQGTVVTGGVVSEIVSILGKPEEIEKETEETTGEEKSSSSSQEKTPLSKKRLYRDVDDKMIAGVCSGLGIYFDIDKAIIRLLFCLFTLCPMFFTGWGWHHDSVVILGFAPVIYLICWLAMPEAKTVKQRFEQKGHTLNIDGIRSSISSETSSTPSKSKSGSSTLGKALLIAIGVILLLGGFGGMTAGSMSFFWGEAFGLKELMRQGMSELAQISPVFVNVSKMAFIRVIFLMVIFLPFVGMIYGGCQLILGFKAPKWHPGLVIFILWLLACVGLGVAIALGAISASAF